MTIDQFLRKLEPINSKVRHENRQTRHIIFYTNENDIAPSLEQASFPTQKLLKIELFAQKLCMDIHKYIYMYK